MPAVKQLLLVATRVAVVAFAAHTAYHIRLHAIKEYGPLIHEFDPWFNFRATQYLHDNGLHAFFHWFDHRSWYPLGRPVGTTIYPGMQLTSVAIYHALAFLGRPMSLNDVCAYVPAWFGVSASLLTGALAAECSGSGSAGAAAALVMAIIPAHLMRSIGGGYDNESIAVTAMCLTFYVWVRSLRSERAWPVGALAGLAYIYMVAAWGGYVFVVNMIGAHAALLVLLGRLGPKLHRAYSLFFVIGTLGAIQFPTVGLAPFKSMEQLGPLAVFLGMQVLYYLERAVSRAKLVRADAWKLRAKVLLVAAAAAAALVVALIPTGYFGPLSMRVRSLFIKHTRTGNPLVDSVAEHQPTSADAYWHHLNVACYAAPAGLAAVLLTGRRDSKWFLALYGLIAYYFANKMNRLIILMGPVASALSGVALGLFFDWAVDAAVAGLALTGLVSDKAGEAAAAAVATAAAAERASRAAAAAAAAAAAPAFVGGPGGGSKEKKRERAAKAAARTPGVAASVGDSIAVPLRRLAATKAAAVLRAVVAVAALATFPPKALAFWKFSHMFAEQMSQPSVVFKARLHSGQTILVTDYMDSYEWLKANTPDDARILSWWDYGYQITGIGNRTTLADGNTWNLEHIALIGRCLTSSEHKAHRLIRHLADYVLVWSGGGGDDLAKSPHMARIGTSVFTDICGARDPMCYSYGFINEQRAPTPMMAASLLYKMTTQGIVQGVTLNSTLFTEVFTTKYQKVRIYKVNRVSQTSRRWLADPANRLCAPGEWYCPGQYPPEIAKLLPAKMLPKNVSTGTGKRI